MMDMYGLTRLDMVSIGFIRGSLSVTYMCNDIFGKTIDNILRWYKQVKIMR